MSKTTARKLDKDGFMMPLALGALVFLIFTFYLLSLSSNQNVSVDLSFKTVEDLKAAEKDLDTHDPAVFNEELKLNTSEASGL